MWDANLKRRVSPYTLLVVLVVLVAHILSLTTVQDLAAKESVLLASRGESLRAVEALAAVVDISA